jgi:hypothetical protein
VDHLRAQVLYVRHDVDQSRVGEHTGEEGSGEETPYPLRRLFLEDEPGAHPHEPHVGRLSLEAVEPAFDLGLVAAVVRARDAAGRPALIHAAVLGPGRVRADRRGVEERRYTGFLYGPGNPCTSFNVHHPLLCEIPGGLDKPGEEYHSVRACKVWDKIVIDHIRRGPLYLRHR